MKFCKKFRAPKGKIDLSKIPADGGKRLPNRKKIEAETAKLTERIMELQYRLYAEDKQALLIVLQGMDTSGKDSTIRKVLGRVNPQGCVVNAFKRPTPRELAHDFLWRVHQVVPGKGIIGVFNRSQYEDVLVVRVHSIVPKSIWSKRYRQINDFEKMLHETGTRIVKINLHIDQDEQKERLEARLEDSTRRWKFNKGDLAERKLWPKYQTAYEDAMGKCNPDHAPWYIVPANRKWYRNWIISNILVETLEDMNPQFPPEEDGLDGIVVE